MRPAGFLFAFVCGRPLTSTFFGAILERNGSIPKRNGSKMPKFVLPLTDLKVKSAKPREKTYKISDGGGLYLEISRSVRNSPWRTTVIGLRRLRMSSIKRR